MYGGDANYSGSTSGTVTQVVYRNTTSCTLTSSAATISSGSTVTFTGTVTSTATLATGTVTFEDGGTSIGIGTLNGSGVATYSTTSLSVTGSPHTIEAVYGGDTNFSGSTSNNVVETVTSSGGLDKTNLLANWIGDGPNYVDTGTATPVATTGDLVGNFHDQTGNGYDLTQATSGDKPAWESGGSAAAVNGHAVVRYNGSTDVSEYNASFPTGNAWTVEMVIVPRTTSAVDFLSGKSYGTGNVTHNWIVSQNTSKLLWYNDDVTITETSAAAYFASGTLVHVTITWDGTHLRFYKNGTLTDTNTPGSSTANLSLLWLGALWDAGSPLYYAQFDWAECGIYNASITTAQFSANSTYLQSQYGVSG